MIPHMPKWVLWALWPPVALIAVVVGVLAYDLFASQPSPVGVSTPLPPAKEVVTVEKVVEKVKYVKVYPEKVKTKLLPAPVAKDPDKRVTATGKLDAEDRPYTLTSVLDVWTGESEVYARPDPLPWIAPSVRTDVGVFIGYKNGEQTVRIEGRQEVLRLKALRLGALASADVAPGGADGFVGVGAWGSF